MNLRAPFMLLLFLLILHGGSTSSSTSRTAPTFSEATQPFVTLDQNQTISLSSDAKRIVGSSSFLILTIGSAKDETLLFNSLLRGLSDNPFADSVEIDDLIIRDPLGRPFLPGAKLAKFCDSWKLPCPQTSTDTTIVFIAVPTDGDDHEDLSWMSLAVSSIVSLSMHVPTPWQPSVPEWETIGGLRGTSLLSTGYEVTRPLVVLVPDAAVSSERDERSDNEYNAARMELDRQRTKALRQLFILDNRSALFVRPDPGRRPNPYGDSMREIAEFICRVVGESEPLPHEDAVAVFDKVAMWVEEKRNGRGDRMTLAMFLCDYVHGRLRRARTSLVQKYEEELLQGYRWFEVDVKAEASAAAVKATEEFRGQFEAFPRALRDLVDGRRWTQEIEWLQAAITEGIPRMAVIRREDFEKEFDIKCSKASREVVQVGKKRLGQWPSWSRELEAEWTARFTDAVRYDDLPPGIRRLVAGPYLNWTHHAVGQLQDEIQSRCDVWWSRMKKISITGLVLVIKILRDFYTA
jgi:hypothetical protein